MNRSSYYSIIGLLSLVIATGCERREDHINLADALKVSNIVPILIVGEGPGGLSAALYAGRSSIATVVVSGNEPGGALTKTTLVENWPGMPHIQGPDAIKVVKEQAAEFGAQFMADTVSAVDLKSWPFKVTTDDGKVLYALTIIIATGSLPVKLGIPGEQEYWGKGVTTCAICDAPYHKDDDVIVVGGGDSAVEEAMQLARYAASVTLCVRKEKLRASARMQERLATYPNIAISYSTEVLEIRGDGDKVTGVVLKNKMTNEASEKAVGGVFLAIGHVPNTAFLEGTLDLLPTGHIAMQGRTQHASVPGVFAAGDVEDARYKQAGSAAGHGINAGLDAVAWLEDHGYNPTFAASLAPKLFKVTAVKRADVPQLGAYAAMKQMLAENSGLAVVDFYAHYCPSCLHMLPTYQEVATLYADRADFYKVDVEVAVDIAKELKIHSVPTLMVFKDGQLIARINKALNKKQLIELIESFE